MSDDGYIAFAVDGEAQPKGSHRALPAGGRPGARPIIVDDNRRSRAWEDRVAAAAGEAMDGRALLDGALRLTVRIGVVRPGTHYTGTGKLSAEGRRHPYPDRRPDLDKLERAICDALTKVVWTDDARVVQKESSKVWGAAARTVIEVEPARPVAPYDGDPQARLDRLDAATGPDLAAGINPREQVGTVLRMLERQPYCRCGTSYEPLDRACPACGRATFSLYAPAKRAAPVPLEPENPAKSEKAA